MTAADRPAGEPDTDRVYERAGWGQRVQRGIRPAVLVVDLMRGFTEAQYATGADLTAEVRATARLLQAARERALPVVFTVIAYDANGLDGGAWLQKAPGLGILKEGTPLVELDPRLPRDAGDTIVSKKGASAFFGTNLAAVLAAQRVDTVLICGATTSGCVRASAVDSVQSGFTTLVPRECVGDRAQGPHEANLFDIDAKYGDVIALEDALAYVAGLAPHAPAGQTQTAPVRPASHAELPAEY
jgi:nicotinamidase-related amidase